MNTPADTVTRLDDDHVEPVGVERSRGLGAGEPSADDGDAFGALCGVDDFGGNARARSTCSDERARRIGGGRLAREEDPVEKRLREGLAMLRCRSDGGETV